MGRISMDTPLDEFQIEFLKINYRTFFKIFLQEKLNLNVEEQDICSGPKWDHYKPRRFVIWDKLSYEELTKIKDFLNAKTVFVYTNSQEERGWEPLNILIIYENENLEDFKEYFLK